MTFDIISFLISKGIGKATLKLIYEHFIKSKQDKNLSISHCQGVNIYYTVNNGPAINYSHELFDTHRVGIINEDCMKEWIPLIESYIADTASNEDKFLREILREEDYQALILSRLAIHFASKCDIESEKKAMKDLRYGFGDRGSRIFNLIRGKYLDNFIYDVVWTRGVCNSDLRSCRDRLLQRFDKMLEYCHNAVFINAGADSIEICNEVLEKLRGKRCVNLHFRENNADIANEAKELIDIKMRECPLHIEIIEDGSILDRKAITWVISKQIDVNYQLPAFFR
ncbi:MAG: hypothetical protein QCI00_08640 [Candidatus Thermoplasmatota archaeon]|nr:hypothetical protein [Candidatus Thermoplasmatota archaeon]